MGTSELEDENWRLIAAYLIVVKPFEKASKTLGGDTYPAACTVVPMLDQLLEDLQKLPDKMEQEELRVERREGREVPHRTW